MSGERLSNNYEKPAWKVEREQDLARKRKIGEVAIGVAAAAIVGLALMHSAKTSEIMNDEERAKNVKKIEVDGIAFYDGVNARKEPAIDNTEPNQLASIGEDGQVVLVDYDGDAYYYDNENDECTFTANLGGMAGTIHYRITINDYYYYIEATSPFAVDVKDEKKTYEMLRLIQMRRPLSEFSR